MEVRLLSLFEVRPGVEVLVSKLGEEHTERPQSLGIAGNHDCFLFLNDLDGATQFGVSHRLLVQTQTPEGQTLTTVLNFEFLVLN